MAARNLHIGGWEGGFFVCVSVYLCGISLCSCPVYDYLVSALVSLFLVIPCMYLQSRLALLCVLQRMILTIQEWVGGIGGRIKDAKFVFVCFCPASCGLGDEGEGDGDGERWEEKRKERLQFGRVIGMTMGFSRYAFLFACSSLLLPLLCLPVPFAFCSFLPFSFVSFISLGCGVFIQVCLIVVFKHEMSVLLLGGLF